MTREEVIAEKLVALLEFAAEGRCLSPTLGDTFFECDLHRNGRRVTIVLSNGLTVRFTVELHGNEDVPY